MKQNRQVSSITQVQQWSGPIPAPDSLEKYEKVAPGSAQIIIDMAVKEQAHRHEREDRMLKQDEDIANKNWKLAITSTIFGFIVVIILTTLVWYALYIGAGTVALGTIIGAIAAVAGLFTFSKIKQGKAEG